MGSRHGSERLVVCAVEEQVSCDGDMSGKHMARWIVPDEGPRRKRMAAGEYTGWVALPVNRMKKGYIQKLLAK